MGLRENLEYRVKLRERCARDERFRKAIWQACKEDILYWFGSFCFLYEPRPRADALGNVLPKCIPFIPWEHQVPAVKAVSAVLGSKDICALKSRGEGFSWIAALLGLHDWIFDPLSKVGFVSNTELKADDPGNLDSLLAKIDWELVRLPKWMVGEKDVDWKRSLSDHSFVNLRNGAQLNSFAATADAGRGGRYKWFFADEMAAWDLGKDRKFLEAIRASTECRFVVSTPNGATGAFFDMVHVPSNAVQIRIHWTQNPYRNRGLYKILDGVPVPVDGKRNPIPVEYVGPGQEVKNLYSRLRAKGFRLEGKLRSPWYDNECDRSDATPQSIAQEYDLDFGGSSYRVFTADFMEKAQSTTCQPLLRGTFDFNPETMAIEFEPQKEGGDCKLWVQLDANGQPPHGQYVVGVDIGSGLGGSFTSNSVCEVIDRVTGEQVLEFSSNMMEPSDFASSCVAISKWFHDAYLGWESNFGGGFTKRVKKLGYDNVYYRTQQWTRGRKKTKEVGWWTDDRTKELLCSDFIRKTKVGEIVVRSEDLVRECGEYVRAGSKSAIVHILSVNTADESSRGKAHGDRVIAFGVAIQLMEDRPLLQKEKSASTTKGPPPANTLAWRVEQWERHDKPLSEWEDGTLADVAGSSVRGGFLD